jgi:hypothetical protein
VERREDRDCIDNEFLRENSGFALEGLYEETDETSSFELSYPSSRSALSFALTCNQRKSNQVKKICIRSHDLVSLLSTPTCKIPFDRKLFQST